ncbi:MAG: hypothetical protein K2J00_06035 [Bacteroidaceae bacterium]|nr:hypothetical protein [Bacteroidaceae bacterium]
MKKIMTMVAVIMMMAAATANSKSIEERIVEPSAVAPFCEVNVNVPARVRVIKGEDYGVLVSVSAMYDAAKLDYRVKDGVLYISTECSEMFSASDRGTMITVITPADDTNVKVGRDVQLFRRKR